MPAVEVGQIGIGAAEHQLLEPGDVATCDWQKEVAHETRADKVRVERYARSSTAAWALRNKSVARELTEQETVVQHSLAVLEKDVEVGLGAEERDEAVKVVIFDEMHELSRSRLLASRNLGRILRLAGGRGAGGVAVSITQRMTNGPGGECWRRREVARHHLDGAHCKS